MNEYNTQLDKIERLKDKIFTPDKEECILIKPDENNKDNEIQSENKQNNTSDKLDLIDLSSLKRKCIGIY